MITCSLFWLDDFMRRPCFSPLDTPPKPTRMARHNPYSIASLRHRIARMIMRKLDRCPYCAQPHRAYQKGGQQNFA
jgi:hypothetical protein